MSLRDDSRLNRNENYANDVLAFHGAQEFAKNSASDWNKNSSLIGALPSGYFSDNVYSNNPVNMGHLSSTTNNPRKSRRPKSATALRNGKILIL